jgi:hypothetical protein
MLEEQLGVEEASRRVLLGAIVSGWVRPDGAQLLSDAIDDYGLAAIALVHETRTEEVDRVLRDAKFHRVASSRSHEIWSTSRGRRDYRGVRGCREYLREFGLD